MRAVAIVVVLPGRSCCATGRGGWGIGGGRCVGCVGWTGVGCGVYIGDVCCRGYRMYNVGVGEVGKARRGEARR
ncbi:hypothetical protein IWX48DRAFT_618217 [Phyllosticta citricarpa]